MTDSLFTTITRIVPGLLGWCTVEKALSLASMVVAYRPITIVEIGIFGGRSLIPMAMACKSIHHGHVIGIDPWEASASAAGQTGENAKWWGHLCNHEQVRQNFFKQLVDLGLNSTVTVHRKCSDDVTPPDAIDLLHSDGNHSDQAIRDVERFAPKVRIGGLVVADDLTWTGNGVSRSVEKLHDFGFIQLYGVFNKDSGGQDDWAVYQRIK